MTTKNWFMLVILLALAVIYVFYFTGWFQPKTIQIFHTSRNMRPDFRAGPTNSGVLPITFGFNRVYKFTEVKVVSLTEWQTNQTTRPLWHLVSDSNSVPVKFFFYGQRIRGMRAAVSGTRPQSLLPGESYRLFVAAGSAKGWHDFKPVAKTIGQ
jgi:hypothetical protein